MFNGCFYFDTGTESHLRHADVDNDGIADLLISVAHQREMQSLLNKPDNISFRDYCKTQGNVFNYF